MAAIFSQFFPMFLLLLLVFPLATYAVKLEDLSWQPDRVTKESILQEHTKLINLATFPGLTTLAYVTPWNPRGYHLARKTASRLTHVSPVWFHMEPVYDDNGEIEDVVIKGEENINTDFTKYLRKENANIKIVPRFRFAPDQFPDVRKTQRMMEKEILVWNVAVKMVKLCKKRKYDGLVLEILDVVYAGHDKKTLEIVMEGIGTMGDMFRKHKLQAILSMPPPVKFKEDGDYWYRDGIILADPCTELLEHFDHIQLWTYSDQITDFRADLQDWVSANVKKFGYSKKMIIGINYYGQEVFQKFREDNPYDVITGKRFLEVLKRDDAELTFKVESTEHILRTNESVIYFPSMTSLEYRMAQAYELQMGIAFWDYGQGLDYFTNLV